MRIKILFASTIVAFSISSCSEKKQEINEPVSEEIITEEEHHHDELEPIVLDEGKKWIVVPEMLQFIRNMEVGINEFSNIEQPTTEEYQELAVLIDKNIVDLTSNCTMQGQAHDELHKWLVPFIGLSEEFDVATDLKEQKRIYQNFKDSYVQFNIYFQ